jgi:2-dehydro-3-deoxyphosphogluconate aldolase/(4S)-4-hydroxy-2-oxoglutarate aldolase
MTQEELFQTLKKYGLVPVIAIEAVDSALPLADALSEGGLPVAEITFRTVAGGEVIARRDNCRRAMDVVRKVRG